jgi:hypothetical protein
LVPELLQLEVTILVAVAVALVALAQEQVAAYKAAMVVQALL